MTDLREADVILYGSNGVCRVDSTEEKDGEGYYVLVPLYKARTKFLVPLSNERLLGRIRALPAERDIERAIEQASSQRISWIDDMSKRRERARQVLEEGNPFAISQLVLMFRAHRRELSERKRRVASSDMAMLHEAEAYLCDMLCAAGSRDGEAAEGFIDSKLSV